MVYNDYYSGTINININAFLNKKVLRSLLKVKIELAWHIAMGSLFCSVRTVCNVPHLPRKKHTRGKLVNSRQLRRGSVKSECNLCQTVIRIDLQIKNN